MDIPRSVVHYDINQTRAKHTHTIRLSEDPEGDNENLDRDAEVYGFYKDIWDRYMLAYRESWRLYEATPETDLRSKAMLLNQSQQCLDRLRSLFARMIPNMGVWNPDFPRPILSEDGQLSVPTYPKETNQADVEPSTPENAANDG